MMVSFPPSGSESFEISNNTKNGNQFYRWPHCTEDKLQFQLNGNKIYWTVWCLLVVKMIVRDHAFLWLISIFSFSILLSLKCTVYTVHFFRSHFLSLKSSRLMFVNMKFMNVQCPNHKYKNMQLSLLANANNLKRRWHVILLKKIWGKLLLYTHI